jgi:hypothetical protein
MAARLLRAATARSRSTARRPAGHRAGRPVGRLCGQPLAIRVRAAHVELAADVVLPAGVAKRIRWYSRPKEYQPP